MEGLTQVFKCIICLSCPRDAHICPHCSKLCCLQCIRRWFSNGNSLCPHCRNTLSEAQLVNCRWANDVTLQLEEMETALARQGFSSVPSDWCEKHQCEMSVYCSTCSLCICHQCALWDEGHNRHDFRDMSKVYEEHVELISTHLSSLRNRQKDLLKLMQEVESNVEGVRRSRDDAVAAVKTKVEAAVADIDSQMKTKLLALVERKNALTEQTQMLETLLYEIETQLRSKARSDLIHHSMELVQMFEKIQHIPSQRHSNPNQVSTEFVSEMLPDSQVGQLELTIPHLNADHADEPCEAVFSVPLRHHGLVWRLKVYPTGTADAHRTHISVFLELVSGPRSEALGGVKCTYDWRIELLPLASATSASTANRPRNATKTRVVREHSCEFEPGECWGYERFYRLELARRNGFINDTDRTVLLKFVVRPSSSYQHSKVQDWYIGCLERELAAARRLDASTTGSLSSLSASRTSLGNLGASSSTPTAAASLASSAVGTPPRLQQQKGSGGSGGGDPDMIASLKALHGSETTEQPGDLPVLASSATSTDALHQRLAHHNAAVPVPTEQPQNLRSPATRRLHDTHVHMDSPAELTRVDAGHRDLRRPVATRTHPNITITSSGAVHDDGSDEGHSRLHQSLLLPAQHLSGSTLSLSSAGIPLSPSPHPEPQVLVTRKLVSPSTSLSSSGFGGDDEDMAAGAGAALSSWRSIQQQAPQPFGGELESYYPRSQPTMAPTAAATGSSSAASSSSGAAAASALSAGGSHPSATSPLSRQPYQHQRQSTNHHHHHHSQTPTQEDASAPRHRQTQQQLQHQQIPRGHGPGANGAVMGGSLPHQKLPNTNTPAAKKTAHVPSQQLSHSLLAASLLRDNHADDDDDDDDDDNGHHHGARFSPNQAGASAAGCGDHLDWEHVLEHGTLTDPEGDESGGDVSLASSCDTESLRGATAFDAFRTDRHGRYDFHHTPSHQNQQQQSHLQLNHPQQQQQQRQQQQHQSQQQQQYQQAQQQMHHHQQRQ